MGKILGILFVTILLGGGIFAYMNLGDFAKAQIEKIGSKTLGVPVTLGGLDIALQDKKVTVGSLKIGNPAGFKKSPVLNVGDIQVQLESVSKELIVFKSIAINNTDINLEVNQNGTNFLAIKNNLPKKGNAPKSENPVKVIVRDFRFNDAKLNPSLLLVDTGNFSTINVPDIRLRGIGARENGVLAGEAIAQVTQQIVTQINKSAGAAGLLQGLSVDTLKDMGISQVNTQVNKVKDEINKQIGGELGNAIGGEIDKGLKSLFGN